MPCFRSRYGFRKLISIALPAASLMSMSQTTILFSLNWHPSGELSREDLETVLKTLVSSDDLTKEETNQLEMQVAR